MIASKKNMDWPEEPAFLIPDDALALFREAVTEGKQAEAAWNDAFAAYQKAHPELAAALTQALNGELPSGWDADLPTWSVGDKAIATARLRSASRPSSLDPTLWCRRFNLNRHNGSFSRHPGKRKFRESLCWA